MEGTMEATAGPELLRDWIARGAVRDPDKPWVIAAEDGRSVTYGQLRDIVGRFASFLRQRGLGRNDRVALLANNSIEQLLCYLGVMAAGATICTIHVEMNRNQLGNIFERLKPQLILSQDGLQLGDLLTRTTVPRLRLGRSDAPEADTLFAALARLEPGEPQNATTPDDDAIILFTSGTSARPKGVILNFREYLLNIEPLANGFGITSDDRLYDFRPFSWNSAQTLGALAVISQGATLVLSEKFSASRF
ncbi:MAG: class I adenylate-forming enzyme family protein, partial [Xanthobacteraceae bacterium]